MESCADDRSAPGVSSSSFYGSLPFCSFSPSPPLSWLFWSGSRRWARKRTLVNRIWESKSQPSSQAIHTRWSTRPTAFSSDRESSDVTDACAAFHRLKTFLLFLDAGALAWVLVRSGRPLFSFSSFPLRQIAPYLFLAALGLAAEVALFGRRHPRLVSQANPIPLPYGRSVMATQLTFAEGFSSVPSLPLASPRRQASS